VQEFILFGHDLLPFEFLPVLRAGGTFKPYAFLIRVHETTISNSLSPFLKGFYMRLNFFVATAVRTGLAIV
jgi:hypothetical protein